MVERLRARRARRRACDRGVQVTALTRETIHPTDRAHWLAVRAPDLTSTEVPALFGLSPYETLFELWHRKRSGEVRDLQDDARRMRGRMFEPVIAKYLAEREGWVIRPMPEYVRVPSLRIGSSFDFRILAPDPQRPFYAVDWDGDSILEIKRVNFLRFDEGWSVDDDWIDAPAHIELQVQHQMLVSGLKRAAIGVDIAGRDETRVLWRDADEAVHAAIIDAAARFWTSIDANRPPDPVYPADAAAVIRMHQFAEPGKLLDARDDAVLATLLRGYHDAASAAARATDDKDAYKARILEHIGDHEKALAPGFTVSASVVAPCTYTVNREAYRAFRVTAKKSKG